MDVYPVLVTYNIKFMLNVKFLKCEIYFCLFTLQNLDFFFSQVIYCNFQVEHSNNPYNKQRNQGKKNQWHYIMFIKCTIIKEQD